MNRCDCCRYVEHLRGVHPMRCKHPALKASLPCGVMRASTGACRLSGDLYAPFAEEEPPTCA